MIDIRKRLPLVLALAAGLLAVFLVNSYLRQKERELSRRPAPPRVKEAQVIVAKRNISMGKRIEEEDLELKSMPEEFIQPRAATSIGRILDMVAIASISKGEQILLNKLSLPGRESTLAMTTPPGKRAITIPVDNISGVGGMVRPGDYVDVLGMVPVPVPVKEGKSATQVVTLPLFQKVLVLAVGSEVVAVSGGEAGRRRRTEKKKETAPIITLALSSQEASILAFVQEQGKVRLVLRSPADTKVEPITPANWDTVLQYVFPQMPKPEIEPRVKVKEERPMVEIYRGFNREVVPLQ